jgi:hypothetical protein
MGASLNNALVTESGTIKPTDIAGRQNRAGTVDGHAELKVGTISYP